MYFNHVISYICTIHVSVWQCLKDLKMYIFMTPIRNNFGSHNKICIHHIGNASVVTAVLHSKQNKESNHQTEQSHGFRQGKSQDSIWEQLLLQRWVPVKSKGTMSLWTSNLFSQLKLTEFLTQTLHNRWWDCRTLSQFQLQIQPLRL